MPAIIVFAFLFNENHLKKNLFYNYDKRQTTIGLPVLLFCNGNIPRWCVKDCSQYEVFLVIEIVNRVMA